MEAKLLWIVDYSCVATCFATQTSRLALRRGECRFALYVQPPGTLQRALVHRVGRVALHTWFFRLERTPSSIPDFDEFALCRVHAVA